MTALERKQHSEKILHTLGIVLFDELPPMEEASDVRLKSAQEIAERILILTYLNCVATDKDLSQPVIEFLHQQILWDKCSDAEKMLFEKTELSEQEEDLIRWRGESIWMLLWTINKVDQLDLPAHEINPNDIFSLLPNFMNSTHEFINTATLRSVPEILDQADLIFRLTWAIQKSQANGSFDLDLNPNIAYERHFAISWVTSIRPQWEETPFV